jgi:hypothetical protein
MSDINLKDEAGCLCVILSGTFFLLGILIFHMIIIPEKFFQGKHECHCNQCANIQQEARE